jgi:two-component system response regulator FixJ
VKTRKNTVKTETKQHVFFVDDEPGIRRVVANDLQGLGYKVSCFANAVQCLKQLPKQSCNLLITDVRMPGMDGLTLLTKVRRIAPWVSVMVITGYGDIPMAVRALKLGAVDFVEKPLQRDVFLKRVKAVLDRDDFSDSSAGQALTRAEKKVLKLVLDGKGNKEIAYKLQRSLRMVEMHRSSIMRKFGVDNVVELVKRAAFMDLADVE